MLYMTVCHIYDIHMTSCVCYVFNHWLLTSKISHYYDLAAGNSRDRVNTRCWLVTAVVVGVAAVEKKKKKTRQITVAKIFLYHGIILPKQRS